MTYFNVIYKKILLNKIQKKIVQVCHGFYFFVKKKVFAFKGSNYYHQNIHKFKLFCRK